ncbi:MAG TPA: sigma-70 family RNA polymerase sigma factor [Acidimicrobiales bacterium]|nr:sigma-70 family RNA polymerase sigma factor [Acidimicrobiales bacterium]
MKLAIEEGAGGRSADVALLADAASGKPEAVRRLLDDSGPVVYGFLYGRVGGNPAVAEDLVQETLLEAVRSSHTFRGDSALTTWLCTIARRRLARYYESERKADVTRAGLSLVRDVPDHAEEDVDRADEVLRALGRLSAMHRQVLVMKYLDEMHVSEMAAELGKTKVQIQSLLQRARDSLRREMSPEGSRDEGSDSDE